MTVLSMTRGDSGQLYTITVSGLTSAGLTGCTLWFTAKHVPDDGDGAAVFQKSTKPSGGIVVTQTGNATTPGVALVSVANADTVGLPAGYATHLVWDAQLLDTSGNLTTLASGTLDVMPEITQATS